ncbi:MAG: adenylate/guanylate cyclase domain-containing protein [Planctomycetota bacterium]
MPAINYVSTPVMIFLTAWMAGDIPRRRMKLIREVAEREARRSRLSRYFSPGVAEVIEQSYDPGDGEKSEISVLFADIRGFTKMSEKLDAAHVVEILNEFHAHMVEVVFDEAGTLDKYLGDGLMAYFNAPVKQPDHAVRAVRCALAMETALQAWNQSKGLAVGQQLQVGIGIHCGLAIVGAIGAPHRREFTAIGDTVNVASRIENHTKTIDGSILVSEALMRLAADDPNLAFDKIEEVVIRGRDEKVRVYQPMLKSVDRAT